MNERAMIAARIHARAPIWGAGTLALGPCRATRVHCAAHHLQLTRARGVIDVTAGSGGLSSRSSSQNKTCICTSAHACACASICGQMSNFVLSTHVIYSCDCFPRASARFLRTKESDE